jgi:transposase
VITMEMLGKIRRMFLRDKLSLHEIAKRTGLSRNTIRSWLRISEEVAPPKYQRAEEPGILMPFHATLEQALKADGHRTKQNRRTAKALFVQIKAEGYAGGYTRVTDFIRHWRGSEGKAIHAFVPLTFELGEAFQFDWGEEGLVVGGIYRRMQVSHLKLCASRGFWMVAYPSQGHEMLFDAHTRSFTALGGVPRRGIYDNMKTAVDKVSKGKGRKVNARFAVMCAHYLFDADFCNVASGWEKGIVEKDVQDQRRRIWLEAQKQQFATFAEVNVWLGERCREQWHALRHPEYKQFSVAEMLEQERSEMMPMPTPFDGYVDKLARVSSTCLVSVSRNRYSVPCELAGKHVSIHLYPERVLIIAGDVVVASHERLPDRDRVRYDWQHYIALVERKPGALRNGAPFADMPAPLKQLRLGLTRHAGGDKIMAQVLATVLTAGLDAVLVAVELVIESGVLSAEHVENVLARLTAGQSPPSVETSLQLTEVPLANTGRYDSLRGIDDVVVIIVAEVDHD